MAAQQHRDEEDHDWSAPELTDDEWRQLIAHSLQEELADPREDIYTPEDGEPPPESGAKSI